MHVERDGCEQPGPPAGRRRTFALRRPVHLDAGGLRTLLAASRARLLMSVSPTFFDNLPTFRSRDVVAGRPSFHLTNEFGLKLRKFEKNPRSAQVARGVDINGRTN